MTITKKNNLLNIWLFSAVYFIIIGVGHYFFLQNMKTEHPPEKIYLIYIFNIVFFAIIAIVNTRIVNKNPLKVAPYYLALTIVRFLCALGFLLPWIIDKTASSYAFSIHFMVVFLLIFFWEAFIVVRYFINSSQ